MSRRAMVEMNHWKKIAVSAATVGLLNVSWIGNVLAAGQDANKPPQDHPDASFEAIAELKEQLRQQQIQIDELTRALVQQRKLVEASEFKGNTPDTSPSEPKGSASNDSRDQSGDFSPV